MTLLLSGAYAPGFVAAHDGTRWQVQPLALGRGEEFIGVAVEQLVHDVARLDRIVVVHGPGSSTGLRIVCSYANGLALATGAALATVSTFDMVRALHPVHPDVLVFPQPYGRTVVARRDGATWRTEEPAQAPAGAWTYDPETLTVSENALNELNVSATPAAVVTPWYWAPPFVTERRKA